MKLLSVTQLNKLSRRLVGWFGRSSQGAGETRSSLQGEFPSMTATDDVVEMVIWLVCGFGLVGLALVGGLVPLHPAPV